MSAKHRNAFFKAARKAFGLAVAEAQQLYRRVSDHLGRPALGLDVKRHPKITARQVSPAKRAATRMANQRRAGLAERKAEAQRAARKAAKIIPKKAAKKLPEKPKRIAPKIPSRITARKAALIAAEKRSAAAKKGWQTRRAAAAERAKPAVVPPELKPMEGTFSGGEQSDEEAEY